MNPSSEYQNLSALRRNEVTSEYKACVALANHGKRLPEEDQLSGEEKILLDVRRLIFQNRLAEAEQALRLLSPTEALLQGDKHFLLGQIFHKQGQQPTACRFMYEAATFYKQTGDLHRELRAQVNGAICVSTLDSCLFGDLYSFEQEARRLGFVDILGNIIRCRSMELLVAERPSEACAQALEAAQLYKIDGYQDDLSVAMFLAAISAFLMGDLLRAQDLRAQALTVSGKSEVYHQIYTALISGKLPKVLEGHTLALVNWKKLVLKPESIPGKIVQRLRSRPRTRDELITEVWGADATDESYCSRLYTAINQLRKEKSIVVVFDGEFYRIA